MIIIFLQIHKLNQNRLGNLFGLMILQKKYIGIEENFNLNNISCFYQKKDY